MRMIVSPMGFSLGCLGHFQAATVAGTLPKIKA
jgi:hypothetical protein